MQTAVNNIENAVATIQGQQSQLAGATSDLNAGWIGSASSAFQNAYNAFNGDFTKMITALTNIQENLQANLRNYSTDEETNTTSATKISQALS
jgi:WXG100 family type VII secretion target